MKDTTTSVLITGGSGGIGYELAKLFAKDHHNLVLVARSGPKLTQIADELQRRFGNIGEDGCTRSRLAGRSVTAL